MRIVGKKLFLDFAAFPSYCLLEEIGIKLSRVLLKDTF